FAKGADRRERTRFDSTVTSRIRRTSTLGNSGFDTKEGDFKWSIIIAIPIELLNIGSDNSLRGRVVKANFYKCGDDLPERHYLTWNPVGTEKPDFHRPEFFGDLYFEK
ncbi:MAG: carbohydrate-binding family 9-like protein, partial [Bacteroidales bacterium]|nr:carbohydrate-binding family 9-like protein [Bacteroidales bacterium]